MEKCCNFCEFMLRQHYFLELPFISCILGVQIIHRSNQEGCKSVSRFCFKMSLIIFHNLRLVVTWFLPPNISEYVFHLHQSRPVVLPRLGREHFTLLCLSPLLHIAFPRETTSFFPEMSFPRLQNIDSCFMLEASSFLILGSRNGF